MLLPYLQQRRRAGRLGGRAGGRASGGLLAAAARPRPWWPRRPARPLARPCQHPAYQQLMTNAVFTALIVGNFTCSCGGLAWLSGLAARCCCPEAWLTL